MEFKLGQKVEYKRYTQKRDMSGDNYVGVEDFNVTYEEKIVDRREVCVLITEPRVGYIAGKRRILFRTTLRLEYNSDPDGDDYVDIVKQEYTTAYLVACSMRNYDYVLEEDLIKMPEAYPEVSKIITAVSTYLARIQLDKETLKVNPLRAEYLKGYRQCRDDVGILARDLIKGRG